MEISRFWSCEIPNLDPELPPPFKPLTKFSMLWISLLDSEFDPGDFGVSWRLSASGGFSIDFDRDELLDPTTWNADDTFDNEDVDDGDVAGGDFGYGENRFCRRRSMAAAVTSELWRGDAAAAFWAARAKWAFSSIGFATAAAARCWCNKRGYKCGGTGGGAGGAGGPRLIPGRVGGVGVRRRRELTSKLFLAGEDVEPGGKIKRNN